MLAAPHTSPQTVALSHYEPVQCRMYSSQLGTCLRTGETEIQMAIRAARPGPSPGWPILSRAVPSPAQYRSGPCRASPRALPAAQAWARGPVSCPASPRSPAYLSGSGLLRPTIGRAGTQPRERRRRRWRGYGGGEARVEQEGREEVRRRRRGEVGRQRL